MHILVRLCLIAIFFSGCARWSKAQDNLQEQSSIQPLETQEARDQLRADLRQTEEFAEQRMTAVTAEIKNRTDERKVRSAVDDWNELVLNRTREIINSEPPVRALLDTWALSEQILEYLIKGDGRKLFKDQQQLAIGAAEDIRDRIAQAASQHLKPEDYEKAQTSIKVYVEENPLKRRGFFSNLFDIRKELFSVVDIGRNTLSTVVSVPLLPGRAAQGIQRGTAEFAEFNETAQRFTQIMERMPEEIRAQIEQLLTRLADSYTTLGPMLTDVQSTAVALDSMMANADSVTTTVQSIIVTARESAPEFTQIINAVNSAAQALEDLTNSVAGLMEQIKAEQGAETRVTETSPTLTGESGAPPFDPQEYQQAASAIGTAAVEVRRVVEEIRLLTEKEEEDDLADPEEEPGRPFDVREYTAAARAIDGAADEVHTILADTRAMTRTGELTSASMALQEGMTAIVDKATLRILQLLGGLFILGFLLAVLYQIIRHFLWARRANHASGPGDSS